ncbi:hypothetical protein O6H91_01G126300 [Diphasiastrum complanatum]|uniref:Uncharacterized protein n=1 Tax=Diphasiastrum complanatum TaxID=34168 RepID=A0ACC2EVS5_DIPCM|nr:hypothetical protein O6H91_01G126300 [Diphasiastrum complanatum]
MRGTLKSVNDLHYLSGLLHAGSKDGTNAAKVKIRDVATLHDCVEVLQDSSDLIHSGLEVLLDSNQMLSNAHLLDIQTWMSNYVCEFSKLLNGSSYNHER